MDDAWLVIFHFGPVPAMIRCLPAVGKLKRSIPDCLLAWVTDEYHADLVIENSLVDKVIVHPVGWRRRCLAAWIRALVYTGNALQRLHPSQIIDFSGGFDCWILEKIAGVVRTPRKAAAFTAFTDLPASARAYRYQESASGRAGKKANNEEFETNGEK